MSARRPVVLPTPVMGAKKENCERTRTYQSLDADIPVGIERVRLNRVTQSGTAGVGANHFSISIRKDFSALSISLPPNSFLVMQQRPIAIGNAQPIPPEIRSICTIREGLSRQRADGYRGLYLVCEFLTQDSSRSAGSLRRSAPQFVALTHTANPSFAYTASSTSGTAHHVRTVWR
jgi:hypothetical protein